MDPAVERGEELAGHDIPIVEPQLLIPPRWQHRQIALIRRREIRIVFKIARHVPPLLRIVERTALRIRARELRVLIEIRRVVNEEITKHRRRRTARIRHDPKGGAATRNVAIRHGCGNPPQTPREGRHEAFGRARTG